MTMDKTQFAKALIKLDWTQSWAGVKLGKHERTIRSYVIGEHPIPPSAVIILQLELEKKGMRMPK